MEQTETTFLEEASFVTTNAQKHLDLGLQYVLQSFNILTLTDPTKIRYIDSRKPGAVTKDQLNNNPATTSYHSKTETQNTFQSSLATFAASMGISGNYGFYSASLQMSTGEKRYDSSRTTIVTNVTSMDCGTINWKLTNTDIIQFLDDSIVNALNNIRSLSDAKSFVDSYGTHIVLGLQFGGIYHSMVSTQTVTSDERKTLSAKINAGYNSGVSSIQASATYSQSLSKNYSQYQMAAETNVIGGDPTKFNPSDTSAWEQTCGDYISGLTHTIEISQLIPDTTSSALLQRYINLVMLAHSIEHPTLFSNTFLLQSNSNNFSVIADKGFKIVSGGAKIDDAGNQNFLTGSYPGVDSANNIMSWISSCHDCMVSYAPTDTLTVYAMAVYDPNNLLAVSCCQNNGSNTSAGYDSASVSLPAGQGFVMTGGGLSTQLIDGTYYKYMKSCYPDPINHFPGIYVWNGKVCDYYHAATNVALTVYIVGVKAVDLKLTPGNSGTELLVGEHGHAVADLPNVIGGGVNVLGDSNLVKASYPGMSSSCNSGCCDQWAEINADTNGLVAQASYAAYALSMTAELILG